MRPTFARVAPPAIAFALLALATPARAQFAEVGVFSSWNRSLGEGLPYFGGSIAGGRGVGVRVSGAMRTARQRQALGAGTSADPEIAGWMADVDLVYDTRNHPVLQPLVTALLGFQPMVFTGAGAMGRRDTASNAMRTVPVFSYGGGVSREVVGGLGLTTEARWRAPVRDTDGSLPAGMAAGWEYRAGLSLRFGGARSFGGRGLPRLPIPTGGGSRGTARASAVLDTGEDYVGVPYVYGGSTPRGFDCSGFVQYVYNRHGVRLPRTSRQQAQVGRGLATRVSSLRAGDLMLFSTGGGRVDHVAIYAGDNRMLHSSSSGGGVRYDDLGSSRGRWFVTKMVSARRVLDQGGASFVDAAQVAAMLREVVTAFDAPDRAPRP